MIAKQYSKSRFRLNLPSIIWIIIWLLWSVGLVTLFWNKIVSFQMTDPDDYMRMLEVRDWISGQSWFDVSQYRMNPPHGADMHWSRFVDLPIAILILLFRPLLGAEMGEVLAMTVMPLLLLGLTMMGLYRSTLRLGDWKIAALAIILLPTGLAVMSQFHPLRVDHHGWQIAMAALALWGLLARDTRWGPGLSGFALAFWIHISIEGLPYAVIFGAVFGVFYLKDAQRTLIYYLAALTTGSITLMISTRDPSELNIAFCDTISWPLLMTFVIITIVVFAADYLLKLHNRVGRLAVTSIAVILGGIFFFSTNGVCAINPFAELSPIVVNLWFNTVAEGLSIFDQQPELSVKIMIVPVIGIAATIFALKQTASSSPYFSNWFALLILLIASTILSSLIIRAGGVAQLFAMPGIAFIIRFLFVKIEQFGSPLARVPSFVVVLLVLSPMNHILITGFFSLHQGNERSSMKVDQDNLDYMCDIRTLQTLPPGKIFAPMYFGPEILFRTEHSVFISGYHRNYVQIEKTILAYTAGMETSRQIVAKSQMDYVYFCSQLPELQIYAHAAPQGLAAKLADNSPPPWLSPVKGPSGKASSVWKVDHKLVEREYLQ